MVMIVSGNDYLVTGKHLLDAFNLILILFHGFKIVDATGGGIVAEVKAKLVGVAPKAIHHKLFDEPFVFCIHDDYSIAGRGSPSDSSQHNWHQRPS
jgi:hypothetical protein